MGVLHGHLSKQGRTVAGRGGDSPSAKQLQPLLPCLGLRKARHLDGDQRRAEVIRSKLKHHLPRRPIAHGDVTDVRRADERSRLDAEPLLRDECEGLRGWVDIELRQQALATAAYGEVASPDGIRERELFRIACAPAGVGIHEDSMCQAEVRDRPSDSPSPLGQWP